MSVCVYVYHVCIYDVDSHAAAFVDEAFRRVGISRRNEMKSFSDERPYSKTAQWNL